MMRLFGKKYSISEIDEMRKSLYVIYDDYSKPDHEDKLRTYMTNGTSPEELQEKAEKVATIRKERGFYHGL